MMSPQQNIFSVNYRKELKLNSFPSETTLVMRHNEKIVVLEGKHRAIQAFQGGIVMPGLGGVQGKPDILEYLFDPNEASNDLFTKLIPIDEFRHYTNPYTY
ncbi:MAG: hypothetical protein HYX60_05345 [Legionella longbeachae]|nr:hypothetical protein [Legionella longbeachae]